MAINTGVNASKIVAFAPLLPPAGVSATKVVSYAALLPVKGISATKIVAYAVLTATNTNPPIWPTFTFSDGVITVAYSQQFDLTPSSSPTTYSVVTGSLPTGLALTSPSGDLGVISGVPTALGTFSFTLRATNAFGTADKSFTINIVAPPSGGGSFTFLS